MPKRESCNRSADIGHTNGESFRLNVKGNGLKTLLELLHLEVAELDAVTLALQPRCPLLEPQSSNRQVTAPLTHSVSTRPMAVISIVFHSPAGLTRPSVTCWLRLKRCFPPLPSGVCPKRKPPLRHRSEPDARYHHPAVADIDAAVITALSSIRV